MAISRPFVWVATQQPGVEVMGLIPGLGWVEESADDFRELFSKGGAAISAGLDILGVIRADSVFATPGQIDMDVLRRLQEPARELRRSASNVPLVSDVLEHMPDMVVSRLGGPSRMVKLYEVERAARGGAIALSTGIDFLLETENANVFVAVTNPAEKRGVQGIVGQYAVMNVRRGRISITQSGSNTDLVDPKVLPEGLSEGYTSFFGESNFEWQNMTMSPFAPDAAEQIAAAWAAQSGQVVDTVVLLDTVALGAVVSATDGVVVTRSGEELTDGTDIARYLSNGIYFDFPEDNVARKEFQSNLEQSLISEILERPLDVERLAREIAPYLADGRVFMWMADAERQSSLEETFIAGGVGSMGDNAIWVGLVNFSGNKMDFYVHPTVETQSCGRDVTVRIRLDNKANAGVEYPDYVARRLDQAGSSPASILGVTILVSSEGLRYVTANSQTWSQSDAFSLNGIPAFQFTTEIEPGQVSEVQIGLGGRFLPEILVSPFVEDVDFRTTPCP